MKFVFSGWNCSDGWSDIWIQSNKSRQTERRSNRSNSWRVKNIHRSSCLSRLRITLMMLKIRQSHLKRFSFNRKYPSDWTRWKWNICSINDLKHFLYTILFIDVLSFSSIKIFLLDMSMVFVLFCRRSLFFLRYSRRKFCEENRSEDSIERFLRVQLILTKLVKVIATRMDFQRHVSQKSSIKDLNKSDVEFLSSTLRNLLDEMKWNSFEQFFGLIFFELIDPSIDITN